MGRSVLLCVLLLIIYITKVQAQDNEFEQYFTNEVLRVDYFLGGDNKNTTVFLDELLREPIWGGPRQLPLQSSSMGNFRYNLYDVQNGRLLYSKGFCPLYQEWQMTDEAKNIQRCMSMTATMPFPKNEVCFVVQQRNYTDGKFVELFSLTIKPSDYLIRPVSVNNYEVRQLLNSGQPTDKVDLVFIPEGYAQNELDKFYTDAKRITDFFFSQSPFDERKSDFNVYAVGAPSLESGTDIPLEGIYNSTLLNSSFSTFDVSRYLSTFDSKNISNVAAHVPYDAVFIIVNSDKYGGGGFYNWYAMGTSDNPLSDTVAIHEFGHSFGGLADEYYASEVAYSEYYNLLVEPWEANITTNTDFTSKWKGMIDKTTPIPTPREAKYEHKIGMFEGGGYITKGVYSPMMDCRMKSNKTKEFCPVCKKGIKRMIDYYCGKDPNK